MTSRKRQTLIILTALICVGVADQVTKAVVMAKIPETVILSRQPPQFFRFTHQRNKALVGGLFTNYPRVAYVAPILATCVLLYLFRHLDPASKLQNIAYGLIAGGAVGNLTDRIRFGSVTDFLQFHFYFIPFDFPWKYYPAFNVADSAICTGVFFLMISWWNVRPEDKISEEKAS